MPEITADMSGTWLDGHMGWHNAYRVVDLATEYGFVIPDDYTAALTDYRENGHECAEGHWEGVSGQGELSDQATDFLQEHAPDGYVFVWDMGELSLMLESETEGYEGVPLDDIPHADYPHEPGRLFDCPRCENECFCTGRPEHTECVFCASLADTNEESA